MDNQFKNHVNNYNTLLKCFLVFYLFPVENPIFRPLGQIIIKFEKKIRKKKSWNMIRPSKFKFS